MEKHLLLAIGLSIAVFPIYRNARASVSDEQIESSAKKSYVFKTYLTGDHIEIESKKGDVTLTGTVSEESHRSLAMETIASIPNVKSVDNRLEVEKKYMPELSDAWITSKVKTNLMFHRSVSFLNTEVTTSNGRVILKGTAVDQAQKNRTTEYAQGIDGVKSVHNEMVVSRSKNKPEESIESEIDDASISGQIKLALLTHGATSALKTKVETEHGVVTLRGHARNKAEKELVTKVSEDIYGVKKINNEMTIETKNN